MMKKIIFNFAFLIVVLSGYTVYSANPGTSGAQFLKIGVGARSNAMGGASAGLSDDVNAIYWNPAGLNQLKTNEISFMQNSWISDISYQFLGYAQPTQWGTMGGAINYLNAGSINAYDNQGNSMNEPFNPTDMALTLSYARMLKGISVGGNIKYISSTIQTESAKAVGIDIGGMYPLLDNKLSIGAVIQNIGTSMKYINESYPLPLNLKIGAAYRYNKCIFVGDINIPNDNDMSLNAGAEYSITINKHQIYPRLGYKSNNTGLNGVSGLSIGVGYMYNNYKIDYAWIPYGDLGSVNQLSLIINFNFKQTR